MPVSCTLGQSKEEEELLRDEEDEGVMEPEVLTIQPFHGPPTGGVLVTIHGHNLRSSHGYGNPTAFVGGVTCKYGWFACCCSNRMQGILQFSASMCTRILYLS